ncbi:hypothetical protein [Legionella taurinensis]|uniref:hypothetical protein n=1 Tax=Legionella taurinensis TaxID=70611 RepID=UPI0010564FF6|nr:hypothetical protein [Legionella taurinensis]MDX1836301.1 hypothetical protein [Legionella taurinensis]
MTQKKSKMARPLRILPQEKSIFLLLFIDSTAIIGLPSRQKLSIKRIVCHLFNQTIMFISQFIPCSASSTLNALARRVVHDLASCVSPVVNVAA